MCLLELHWAFEFINGERVMNSSNTDTGLGCSSQHLLISAVELNRSENCTVSMIFLSAFKSSLHFSNAMSNFLLLSAADSGIIVIVVGIASKPIRRATSAGGLRKFWGEFTEFDRRISAGSVGLLGTSQESLRRSLVGLMSFCFWFCGCIDDGKASWVGTEGFCFVGEETTFFSCFFPEHFEIY